MNELIILCAKYLFAVSILVLIVYWLKLPNDRKKQLALVTVIGGIVALVLAKISGHFYYDARPFVSNGVTPLISHAADNGFPSDHTLITALIGFAVLVFSRRLGAALLLVALAVGASRVAAGIHHPLDILGSFVITGVAVAATWTVMQVADKKPRTKES